MQQAPSAVDRRAQGHAEQHPQTAKTNPTYGFEEVMHQRDDLVRAHRLEGTEGPLFAKRRYAETVVTGPPKTFRHRQAHSFRDRSMRLRILKPRRADIVEDSE